MKNVVFIDMDRVLADFDGGLWKIVPNPPDMYKPSFFRYLEVLPGAKEGVKALLDNPNLDVYIASKYLDATDYCVSEKMGWLRQHFPELIGKVMLVCDKTKLLGDYLIDDDLVWKEFNGEFIHFDKYNPETEWKRIVGYLNG